MTPVESFIPRQNIKNFKQQLEATTDDALRTMLLRLLAQEQAKGEQLVAEPNSRAS